MSATNRLTSPAFIEETIKTPNFHIKVATSSKTPPFYGIEHKILPGNVVRFTGNDQGKADIFSVDADGSIHLNKAFNAGTPVFSVNSYNQLTLSLYEHYAPDEVSVEFTIIHK